MKKITLISFLLFFVSTFSFAQDSVPFQSEVDAITQIEFVIDESKEVVVFTGSSSIRMWKDVQEYYPHVNALNTGFGGSQFKDLIHFREELIFNFNPDRIFIYEGDNDISSGKEPSYILSEAKLLLSQIRSKYSDVPVYFISPKPSISRWNYKENYEALNVLLKDFSESQESTFFIDVWNPMLNQKGEPMTDIFISDNLHMNEKGYQIWGKIIGEYLETIPDED